MACARCSTGRGVSARWLLAAALAGLALVAGRADARTETIRWTHSAPQRVTGFRIYLGPGAATFPSSLNVGLPTASGGVYSATVTLGDSELAYAVVSALGSAGEESAYSNVRTLTPPPANPDPDPDPDPNPDPDPDPAPVGDAVWSSNFENVAVGGNPGGWVDTKERHSLAVNDAIFQVATVGNTRAFGTSSTQPNVHSHYVTAESQRWSAYEYRGRMQITNSGGGIGITALSQYPRADAYYRIRRYAGTGATAFHISPRPEDRPLECRSKSTGLIPSVNTWYRFRMQVDAASGGTTIRARVWRDGATEPTTWQIDCVDRSATRLVAGAPGVWSLGKGGKYWDDLEVVPLDSATAGGGGSDPGLGLPAAPLIIE